MAAPKVRLTEFRIRGYRSCRNVTFRPQEHLSVLIGPNGAGKTNLLQALQLLRPVFRYRSKSAIADRSSQRSSVYAKFSIGKREVKYKAFIYYSTNSRNKDDVVFSEVKMNFSEFGLGNSWIAINDIRRQLDSPEYYFDRRGRHIGIRRRHIERDLRLQFETAINAASLIEGFCGDTLYLSASRFADPSLCPSSFEIGEGGDMRRTLRDRGGHTDFLYDLYNLSVKHPEEYTAYMALVGRDGVSIVENIHFDQVFVPSSKYRVGNGGNVVLEESKSLLLIPTVEVHGVKLSFGQLSEGTLKTLGILFYLTTSKQSLFLIEEPETSIHHGLLRSIIEIAVSTSKRKQVILSTHADAVLDSVSPESVYVVSASPTGTNVKAITNKLSSRRLLALKNYLQTSGSLGEYWKHGGLDS